MFPKKEYSGEIVRTSHKNPYDIVGALLYTSSTLDQPVLLLSISATAWINAAAQNMPHRVRRAPPLITVMGTVIETGLRSDGSTSMSNRQTGCAVDIIAERNRTRCGRVRRYS